MVDRISALSGNYKVGLFGSLKENETAGIQLQDMHGLILHQLAAWPESLDQVGNLAAGKLGLNEYSGPSYASVKSDENFDEVAMLRIEPLKWWVYGAPAPELGPELGATLDLSHSRTHIRVTGSDAATVLNKHLALDLREQSFAINSVASTVFHHVGVTLWRSVAGYELFIPRGFALSLWEPLVHSSEQYGLEVM